MLTNEFRRRCENLAIHFRHEMGLYGYNPVQAISLAKHLGVKVIEPSLLLSGTDLDAALVSKKWFAVTIPVSPLVIVYHPGQGRISRETSLMHELAHIILRHQPEQLRLVAGTIASRSYSRSKEQEADYLAKKLQLPSLAVKYLLRSDQSIDEISVLYGVEPIDVKYRLSQKR